MTHTLVLMGLIFVSLLGCSPTTSQLDTPVKQTQAESNPILGTWRLIPGQSGGEYWPKPCREITFEKRASYCGGSGSPNSYEVRQGEVIVYDERFEQIYKFPSDNTMTTNIPGVGILKFERIK